MAEANDTGVDFKTGLFSLGLKGGNALFFFLLLVLGINIALTFYEHVQRSEEHDRIICATKLAIFVYTTPRKPSGLIDIDFEHMPVDMYSCLPAWLYKRGGTP